MDFPSVAGNRRLAQCPNTLVQLVLLSALVIGCSSSFAEALKVIVSGADGHPVSRAAVLVRPTDPNQPSAMATSATEMQQIKAAFVPDALIIAQGSAVNFPNFDRTRHHVYSFSEARQFELKLYKGTPAEPVVFDKLGVVALGCNIHDWMYGLIYVVDTPHAALTDDNGVASVEHLALGEFQIEVWHPLIPDDSPVSRVTVAVAENDSATAVAITVDLLDAPPRPARPASLGTAE